LPKLGFADFGKPRVGSEVKIAHNTIEAHEIGKHLTREEAIKVWEEYKRRKSIKYPDDMSMSELQTLSDRLTENQFLREQVEAHLGFTGLLSLTPEEIENKLIDKSLRDFIGKPNTQENRNKIADILIKSIPVKGFTRVRRGRYEIVKPYSRTAQQREQELKQKRLQSLGPIAEVMKEKLEGVVIPEPPKRPFYSALEKLVTDKFPTAMPGNQVKSFLVNHGIKEEEIKWSKVDQLFGRSRVTKEDIQKWVVENSVKITEIIKFDRPPEMTETADLYYATETKFGPRSHPTLNLAGGKNYRELLLTLTERGRNPTWEEYSKYYKYSPNDVEAKTYYKSDLERGTFEKGLLDSIGIRTEGYSSAHWDEPNILAHVRFQEFKDIGSAKVLLLEEVQSDWHQTGRRKGYQSKEKVFTVLVEGIPVASYDTEELANKDLEAHLKLYPNSAAKIAEEFMDIDERAKRAKAAFKKFEDEMLSKYDTKTTLSVEEDKKWSELYHEYQMLLNRELSVPEAPFKNTWHELCMRRMLHMAAEDGFDKLAWTTGEQQAERYDLSKQVDEVRIGHNEFGYYVQAVPVNSDQLITEAGLSRDNLSQVVGKDLAARALKDLEGKEGGYHKTYSGIDLKVGGEGMKGFYDKILVDYANKLGKPYGVKVEETELENVTDYKDFRIRKEDDALWPVPNFILEGLSQDDKWLALDNFEAASLAAEAMEGRKEIERAYAKRNRMVHSLVITPKMREDLDKGTPLFKSEDEELYVIKAMPIKGFFRTRRGRQEWVKPYRREADGIKGVIPIEIDGIQFIQADRSKRNKEQIVLIDVAKFDAEWAKDHDFYISPAGSNKIGNRIESFKEFLATGQPVEMSEVSFRDIPDIASKVGFTNGRHRFAVLRDMGIKVIPISVDKKSAKNIEELFGYCKDEIIERPNLFIDVNKSKVVLHELKKSKLIGKSIPYKLNDKVVWAKVSDRGLLIKGSRKVAKIGSNVLLKSGLARISAVGKDGVTARTSGGSKVLVLYKDLDILIKK